MTTTPPQRLARPEDAPAIQRLMRASAEALFPRFYAPHEAASAVEHIALLDEQLIADGTYFVHEADGEIVACGGWSRRAKLFTGPGPRDDDARLLDPAAEPARVRAMFVREDWTRRGLGQAILRACESAARAEGFRMLELMATLPGVPLYRAYGFAEVEHLRIANPDGVTLDAVRMERRIDAHEPPDEGGGLDGRA